MNPDPELRSMSRRIVARLRRVGRCSPAGLAVDLGARTTTVLYALLDLMDAGTITYEPDPEGILRPDVRLVEARQMDLGVELPEGRL